MCKLIKARMWFPLLAILTVGLLLGCGSPSSTPTPPLPDDSSEAPAAASQTEEPPDSPEVANHQDESARPPDMLEVVYFHRPSRCSSCLYIEAATRFTLETYFQDELASGRIVFKVVNLGDAVDAAVIEQYGASTSSLFMNAVRDGVDDIEEVYEVWFLLDNGEEFVRLVASKIDEHLTESS